MTEQTLRRRKKIQEHIDRIVSQRKQLPDAFIKWGKKQLQPYLVYEPGDNKRAICTRCGKEHNFQKKLKMNTEHRCPSCGAECICKTPKTLPKWKKETLVYMQKINDGILVRFVVFHRGYEDWPYINDIQEENLMVAMEHGKRQYWFEKRRRFDYQPDSNWYRNTVKKWVKTYNAPNYGMENYSYGCFGAIRSYNHVKIYKKNIKSLLKGHPLEYMDMEEIVEKLQNRSRQYEKIYSFIEVYDKLGRFPQIESLWKIGFEKLSLDLLTSEKKNLNKSDKLHQALGISKELWNYILENKMKTVSLEQIRQMKTIDKICWKKDIVVKAYDLFSKYEMERYFAQAHMNIEKTMKFCEENKKERYLYTDYLNMAIELGYDMKDDFVAYPRHIEQAHDAAIAVRDEEKNRKKLEQAAEKDNDIRKVERKIRKRFSFEDDKFLIRPAKTNREIVKEGQIQHICVGSGYYSNNMINGTSYILFLRRKESPDVPFYTVEIDKDYKIRQRHGKYNEQHEEVVEVDKFLNKFVEAKTNGEKHYA